MSNQCQLGFTRLQPYVRTYRSSVSISRVALLSRLAATASPRAFSSSLSHNASICWYAPSSSVSKCCKHNCYVCNTSDTYSASTCLQRRWGLVLEPHQQPCLHHPELLCACAKQLTNLLQHHSKLHHRAHVKAQPIRLRNVPQSDCR